MRFRECDWRSLKLRQRVKQLRLVRKQRLWRPPQRRRVIPLVDFLDFYPERVNQNWAMQLADWQRGINSDRRTIRDL